MKKKVIALVLVCVLVFGVAVGGTLAYLMQKTETVTNTFTTSDVSIKLTENGEEITSSVSKSFKMVPGVPIDKNVDVTALKNSEACYLFVKIEESANFSAYFDTYTVNSAWTKVEGTENVYYCKVDANGADGTLTEDVKKDVIESVTVKTTVKKADMTTAKNNVPTLSFTAYGIQQAGFADAAAAWAEAEKLD